MQRLDGADVGIHVESAVDRLLDEFFLGREDPEDRALGHAGGLGDLGRGDGASVLENEGQGDLHEGSATVLRSGAGARRVTSEHSN